MPGHSTRLHNDPGIAVTDPGSGDAPRFPRAIASHGSNVAKAPVAGSMSRGRSRTLSLQRARPVA